MRKSTDISNLYRRLGENPAQYREIGQAEQANARLDRWPLLSAVRLDRAAAEPVVVTNDGTTGHEAAEPEATVAERVATAPAAVPADAAIVEPTLRDERPAAYLSTLFASKPTPPVEAEPAPAPAPVSVPAAIPAAVVVQPGPAQPAPAQPVFAQPHVAQPAPAQPAPFASAQPAAAPSATDQPAEPAGLGGVFARLARAPRPAGTRDAASPW
jgi:hypothetical protein